MSDRLQESIFQAIDNIARNRIDRLATDKTVTATIVQCNNSLTGEHTVNYQGGNFVAYSQDGVTYSRNTSVYVLVPEGDFSKKKLIVGKATLLEDDSNISFVSSLLENYNLIGRNVITHNGEESFGLHSYLVDDYYLIYDFTDTENNKVTIDIEEFQNNLKEAQAIMLEASFQTRLPREHRNTKTGMYALEFVLAFKDRSVPDENAYKYYSYIIDTNNMTGNPYAYSKWSDQYAIFPIDIENFSHIQTILFYSHGFVEEDDYINDTMWGADIWCNNLEIYGLKPIDSSNGDYRLKISLPDGNTFKTSAPNTSLSVLASVKYKENYITDGTMFYWFVEDARVTTSSEFYQMYGGVGWKRLKDKGTKATLVSFETENRAYENKYLCVAVYKEQVILKEYFTIYNDTQKRDIGIISDLGVKFGFDRGKPVLTCQIDGRSENFDAGNVLNRPDGYFTFIWSKISEGNQVYSFTRTYEQIEQEYDDGLERGIGYAALSNLKIEMEMTRGSKFPKGLNGNQLIYPIRAVDNTATFRCSVYLRDSDDGESYFIGSADITLQNENSAEPADYYIIIENGDQVFQYSESGVSPTNERYKDPLKVLPLTAHFYDPAGLEVNAGTYGIKWLVPLEDTMIKIPTELTRNPANDRIEWYTAAPTYPMDIVQNYDYQALNNQVTAIVSYQGEEWTKETNFLFVKVGDNGTNGTDIVAKISPNSKSNILDTDMLTMEIASDGIVKWNTGQDILEPVLQFDLYQRDKKLVLNFVTWSLAGKTSKQMSITGDVNGATLSYGPSSSTARDLNQIVKAQTSLTDENDNTGTYYAYFQIPIVKYNKISDYKVHVDTDYTLKQILYNQDGRNPLYNKNQGFKIRIEAFEGVAGKVVFLEAIGGATDRNTRETQDTCAFRFIPEKNSEAAFSSSVYTLDDSGELMVYILPNDVYSGLCTNNLVHGVIYSSREQLGQNPECEFWVPIHMQLNVYGLASLNSWDGNHIEINEEDNYILAPQIGAGEKNADNTFTGVVMGKAQTYDMEDPIIGLLGYSHGKQSIYLDANTGNAIFGLTEDDPLDKNNPLTEGRIELIPGGISSIAQWKIDSRSLYNVVDGSIGRKYSDAPSGAERSIPHDKQGILLNAKPAYLSIKGHPLMGDEIDMDNANLILDEGDALELQMDSNDLSLFTIYRHTCHTDNNEWRRIPLVGIDGAGRFYANMLRQPVGEGTSTSTVATALNIGYIGAFGANAGDSQYVGSSIDIGTRALFKMFTDVATMTVNNSPIYLSGSSSRTNEYIRPLNIYGKNINLYADDFSNTTKSSLNYLSLSSTEASLFNQGSYLQLKNGDTSSLVTARDFSEIVKNAKTVNVTGAVTKTLNSTLTESVKNTVSKTWGSAANITITNNLTLLTGTSGGFQIKTTNGSNMIIGTQTQNLGSSSSWATFSIAGKSQLEATNGWDIACTTGGIAISSSAASAGITLDASMGGSTTYLHLSPQSGGGQWALSTRAATIMSQTSGSVSMVQATPGIGTPWITLTGSYPGTSNSVSASNDIRTSANFYGKEAYLSNLTCYSNGAVAGWINTHDKWAGEQASRIQALEDRMSAVEGRANDAYNLAATKANANHTHSGYASSSHTHSYTNTVYTLHHAGMWMIDNTQLEKYGVSISASNNSQTTSGPN